jgi:tRNA pseudouridine65 synthase
VISDVDDDALCCSKAPLEILFKDEHFIAINKPHNLFVHRTNLDRTQLDSATQRLRAQFNEAVTPVHRLDRPTSGVLLFARHIEAIRRMNTLFADRLVHKEYLALVRGHVEQKGIIDYPLKHKTRQQMQQAITHWQLLEHGSLPVATPPHTTSRFSLVNLYPQTGRWHQLRRHFAHLRHPIIGDTSHGDAHQNRTLRRLLPPPRLFLHSQKLRFTHPFCPDLVCTIESQPPVSFRALSALFGWLDPTTKSEV